MEIYEDRFLRLVARDPVSGSQSGSVLLSFTGIGHAMGVMNVQKPEFFGTGRTFDNIIFITDKTRSWSNALDFDRIARDISPYVEGRKIYAIGNSMGGFNAIAASAFLAVTGCIAFAPQFSVKPEIVPWETRWSEYRSEIETFRLESLAQCFNQETRYFLFSGGRGRDLRHAQMFPVQDNITHYAFADIAHNVAGQLKKQGVLETCVASCLVGADRLDIGLSHHQLSPMHL